MVFIMICNSNIILFGMRICSYFKGWRANSDAIYCDFECTEIWRTNLAPATLHTDYPTELPKDCFWFSDKSCDSTWVIHIGGMPTTKVISLALENYFHNFILIRARQNTGMAGQLFPWSPWKVVGSTCLKESFFSAMAGWGKVRARQLHVE